jgi:hypothetical protein
VSSVVLILISFLSGFGFALYCFKKHLKRFEHPDVAREWLSTLYKRAHPHPLQVSEFDPTPLCPVCGYHLKIAEYERAKDAEKKPE